jgi:hypothetical protein
VFADNSTLLNPDFFEDRIQFVDVTTGTVTDLGCR